MHTWYVTGTILVLPCAGTWYKQGGFPGLCGHLAKKETIQYGKKKAKLFVSAQSINYYLPKRTAKQFRSFKLLAAEGQAQEFKQT